MEKITSNPKEAIAHSFAGSTVRFFTPRGHALIVRYAPGLYVTVDDAGSDRQLARIHDPIVTWDGACSSVMLRAQPLGHDKVKCETKSQALEWIAFAWDANRQIA